jgi:RNA polymerase sigma-70 factor, ECF subfamily
MVVTLNAAESASVSQPRLTAEELCRVYAPDVCRFAAMMAPSSPDAEDLAQEALMRAVRGLHRFDPSRGPITGWLWRIVANAARDAASRRQRFQDLVIRAGLLMPRETETVEDAVLSRIGDADLHAALRGLPLRDRTLIAFRYGAGLDAREAGNAIGLSAESTSRATRRALARLRARLEEVREH